MSKHGGQRIRNLTIRDHENGVGQRVVIDGRDIAGSLTGLFLRLGADRRPMAVLDVHVETVDAGLDDVQVVLPDETRDLLIDLGWTPPPEGGGNGTEEVPHAVD